MEAEAAVDVGLALALQRRLAQGASDLITMGCGENCPYVPGARVLDWPLEDPKGKPLEEVRRIRGEVEERVRALLAERGG